MNEKSKQKVIDTIINIACEIKKENKKPIIEHEDKVDISKIFNMDSLDLIRFLISIEKEFSIKISAEDLDFTKLNSLEYLCKCIMNNK